MLLIDLLKVMESDTRIHVELNHAEVYEGKVIDIDLPLATLKKEVKSIWYSTLCKAIWIDL